MLAAAYSVFLIVDITVNTCSVPHLIGPWRQRRSPPVSMISVGALLNAGARLGGGLVSRFISVQHCC